MSINYPSSLDSFANPSSTDLMENASPALDHDVQHSNANDAIEALEAKVGADGSAVTTSHDYKLSGVTGSDKAVSKTGTETLTNKTLTSPVINVGSDSTGDMYYRNSSGAYTRLPIGTSAQILNVDNVTGLPTWVANPSGSDASTTVKGVVEIATQAEVLAKTGTGGTGAKLVVSPDNMNSTLVYDGATDSVGTDSYAITLTPAPTAYTTYQKFTFKAGTANTGACSLNVNGLGAKTIKKRYNQDLSTGDILANQIIEVVYDGTNFQNCTPSSNIFTVYNTGLVSYSGLKDGGTVVIAHGLGVSPRRVIINSRATAPVSSQGVWNGSTYQTIYTESYPSSSTNTTYIVYLVTNTGSGFITQGTIAVDSTNITITWVSDGSGGSATGVGLWEAYA